MDAPRRAVIKAEADEVLPGQEEGAPGECRRSDVSRERVLAPVVGAEELVRRPQVVQFASVDVEGQGSRASMNGEEGPSSSFAMYHRERAARDLRPETQGPCIE